MAEISEPKITYTWSIPDTVWNDNPTTNGEVGTGDFGGLTDVIHDTTWSCKGVAEDGIEAIVHGSTPISSPETTDGFVAFESVTPAMLASWLFSAPDGTGRLSKADQESKVADKIRAARAAKAAETRGAPTRRKLPATED